MMTIHNWEEYQEQYTKSVSEPESFWAGVAGNFQWRRPWDKVLEWDFNRPEVQWYQGAKLNITENCLDRHLKTSGEKVALLWEPNDPAGTPKKYTYSQLHAEVCRLANGLRKLGVGKGDRVCFYMPMVPELAIGLLACARIGAIHTVVFAGFSSNSLADRIKDSEAGVVICSDFNNRGGKTIPVKDVVDEALGMDCDSVKHVIVHRNTGSRVDWSDRDIWMHELVHGEPLTCEAEVMDSEDILFILYTSGSTGKPKGVVHTCGGYMVYTCYSFVNVFQYKPGDIYWCTADIGWITGHSYIVYGPLLAGATTLMFEGVPTFPDPGRFWSVCEKYGVNQFYTAPTAIRALMANGNEWPEKYDLSALKVLGTVGEPINEEAWEWYNDKIGKGKIPIVDTWWQTETGGILISPLAGITKTKPSYAMRPLPGVQPCLVDVEGKFIEGNSVEGLLCMKFPWPSILRTTWGDHDRCRQTYFSQFPGLYFTGDGAKRDEDGNYRVIGRVDDVINVSGHRIGTAELEDAINEHEDVIESAVVGYPHEIKGQGIFAFLITNNGQGNSSKIADEIRDLISRLIGPIAKPDRVLVVDGLPKTRSGKIMRRILRKIASGEEDQLGDTSTLLNPEIVDKIIRSVK